MASASSLFDAPSSPVLPSALDWLTGTLLGSVAVTLCVIAVAFVGLRLLTGFLAVRDGLRVILGCFVLLGAPFIAAGLIDVADRSEVTSQPPASSSEPLDGQAPVVGR